MDQLHHHQMYPSRSIYRLTAGQISHEIRFRRWAKQEGGKNDGTSAKNKKGQLRRRGGWYGEESGDCWREYYFWFPSEYGDVVHRGTVKRSNGQRNARQF